MEGRLEPSTSRGMERWRRDGECKIKQINKIKSLPSNSTKLQDKQRYTSNILLYEVTVPWSN